VDLAARLREPGYEHEGMLATEMAAAVAGGVTSVCPPDTDPVLDESGLVEMLKYRAEKLQRARLFPLGAITRGLAGEVLTEMAELTEAGCVGFGQADVPLTNTQVLQRALQYASTFGYTLWLRPQTRPGKGVAASGPLATRLGLAGVPVAAETIAVFTIIELMRNTGARVHLCRLLQRGGRRARAGSQGRRPAADLRREHQFAALVRHRHRVLRQPGTPESPLRQQRDRDALSAALPTATIDALVSDHTPVETDAKTLPFAESEPGATGLELLLPLALQWGEQSGAGLKRAIEVITSAPARMLAAAGSARVAVGAVADLCIFDPATEWQVKARGAEEPGQAHALCRLRPARPRARHAGRRSRGP